MLLLKSRESVWKECKVRVVSLLLSLLLVVLRFDPAPARSQARGILLDRPILPRGFVTGGGALGAVAQPLLVQLASHLASCCISCPLSLSSLASQQDASFYKTSLGKLKSFSTHTQARKPQKHVASNDSTTARHTRHPSPHTFAPSHLNHHVEASIGQAQEPPYSALVGSRGEAQAAASVPG